MIHVSVVAYNQHNVFLKQWSTDCLSNSKSQSISGTSDQLSEGRKKRHLSETAVGKRQIVLRQYYFLKHFITVEMSLSLGF